MAFVTPLADAQASEAAKGIFQNLQAKMGKVLNIFRTLGYVPEILQATYLKTTQVNQCNY